MSQVELIKFRTQEEWLRARKGSIGSTAAASIMGANPYKSALALYADILLENETEKTGKMKRGSKMEPLVCEEYEEQTGFQLINHAPCIHRNGDYPWAHTSIDREIICPNLTGIPGILEVKTVSAQAKKNWLEEIPLYYLVQMQHHFLVTEWTWGAFAVLEIDNWELLTIPTEPNRKFLEVLAEKEAEFVKCLKDRNPPPPDSSESSKEALSKLYSAETGEIVALPGFCMTLDDELQEVKAAIKAQEEKKTALENQIKMELKDALKGVMPNGIAYTWKTMNVPEKVVKAYSTRVLRRSTKG